METTQRAVFFALLIVCFNLGIFASTFLQRHQSESVSDNYTVAAEAAFPPRQCEAPSSIRERSPALDPTCIQLENAGPTSLQFKLSKHAETIEADLSPKTRYSGIPVASERFNCSWGAATCVLTFTVRNLLPDADYVLSVSSISRSRRELLCQKEVSTTTADGNLLLNPGFEEAGDAPYPPTRFLKGSSFTPRRWTSFYNGGVRLQCGRMGDIAPRSGLCMAVLGPVPDGFAADDAAEKFYGAHQGVRLSPHVRTFMVGAWYRVTADLLNATWADDSPHDALSLITSWRWDDGTVDDGFALPLRIQPAARAWTLACVLVHLPPPRHLRALDVFVHRHGAGAGALLVDDAFARPLQWRAGRLEAPGGFPVDARRCAHVEARTPAPRWTPGPAERAPDLRATAPAGAQQLTLAVPLTAERVLRLAALARQYGGGPVVAAVLVRGRDDAAAFAHVWRRDAWLRGHVSVRFVRAPRGPLPINALRNAALALARTEFVAMLDVDMVPATAPFACFRDPSGAYLRAFLPPGARRVLALPVFVAASGARPPRAKPELLNMLGMRSATTYCLDSQRPVRVARWYREQEPYEVRFVAGYEPYAIGRTESYPRFDERFVGYGFNKISWALGAERDGFSIVVLHDAFVTHLNHVENEWVQSISVPVYLNTWRRYFAFVAEGAY